MAAKKKLSILFIGNSHTYCNDMPFMAQRRFAEEGFDCRVTMLAHPGWYLSQHVQEPEARFNILYGNYNYVVLQEHAHPFVREEEYLEAVRVLNGWIREAGSVPVIYGTWARENEPEQQEHMNEVHRKAAEDIGALLAPVGENWWTYKESWPAIKMYAGDGAHASEAGSDFAAKYIWHTIMSDLWRKEYK